MLLALIMGREMEYVFAAIPVSCIRTGPNRRVWDKNSYSRPHLVRGYAIARLDMWRSWDFLD